LQREREREGGRKIARVRDIESERARERERKSPRCRERESERESARAKQREREKECDREREKECDRERERKSASETEKERDLHEVDVAVLDATAQQHNLPHPRVLLRGRVQISKLTFATQKVTCAAENHFCN